MKRNARRIIAASAIAALAAGSVLFLSSAQAARTVTPVKQARATVLSAVPGTVLSVKKKTRSGFTAWAITVKRSDGSVVVGYVDIKSGIAFDWTVKAAPGEPAIDLDGSDSVLEPADPPKPLPTPTSSPTPTPTPTPTASPAPAPAAPAAAPAAPVVTDDPSEDETGADDNAERPEGGRGEGNRGDGNRGDGDRGNGSRGDGRPPRDGSRQGASNPPPAAPAGPAAAPAPQAVPQQGAQQQGDGGGRGGGRRSFARPAA